MPDPNLVFRLNNVPFSFQSTSHFIDGAPYKGITKVSYKESRKRVYVPAAQQDGTPVGITAGVYRVESLSFTFLRDSWQVGAAIDLTALGAGSIGDAQFDYMLQLFEPGASLPTQTLISGVVVEDIEEDQEFSEDGGPYLVTVVSCKAMFVLKTVGGVPQQLWSLLRS